MNPHTKNEQKFPHQHNPMNQEQKIPNLFGRAKKTQQPPINPLLPPMHQQSPKEENKPQADGKRDIDAEFKDIVAKARNELFKSRQKPEPRNFLFNQSKSPRNVLDENFRQSPLITPSHATSSLFKDNNTGTNNSTTPTNFVRSQSSGPAQSSDEKTEASHSSLQIQHVASSPIENPSRFANSIYGKVGRSSSDKKREETALAAAHSAASNNNDQQHKQNVKKFVQFMIDKKFTMPRNIQMSGLQLHNHGSFSEPDSGDEFDFERDNSRSDSKSQQSDEEGDADGNGFRNQQKSRKKPKLPLYKAQDKQLELIVEDLIEEEDDSAEPLSKQQQLLKQQSSISHPSSPSKYDLNMKRNWLAGTSRGNPATFKNKVGGFAYSIHSVLNRSSPKIGITKEGTKIINSILCDIMEQICGEAQFQCKINRQKILKSKNIQDALKKILPKKLQEGSIKAGQKAVNKFNQN